MIMATRSAPAAVDAPAEAPTIFAPILQIGWRVDRMSGANVCFLTGPDRCGPGEPTARPGGFDFPGSVVADARDGALYVADLSNRRVQAFAPTGHLRTVIGPFAGELSQPIGLASDPVTGDLYVREVAANDASIEKITAAGRFLWVAGGGVNRRTGANLCRSSAESRRVLCGPGRPARSDRNEPEIFAMAIQPGDVLAWGGPRRLLYVADEHRVGELDASGRWRGEILLASLSAAPTSSVGALAVDPNGDLYLVYQTPHTPGQTSGYALVRRFDAAGVQTAEFAVMARLAQAELHIDGIAIDRSGRLAVIGVEVIGSSHARFGLLYAASSGRLLGEFPPPPDNDGLTFGPGGELYVAATDDQEVIEYLPLSASEQLTGPWLLPKL
jgi:hypothetical protein